MMAVGGRRRSDANCGPQSLSNGRAGATRGRYSMEEIPMSRFDSDYRERRAECFSLSLTDLDKYVSPGVEKHLELALPPDFHSHDLHLWPQARPLIGVRSKPRGR